MTSESNSPKEGFPNSKMRAIIDRAIREKASNPYYFVGGERKQIPTSSYSDGQLSAYKTTINAWAMSPITPAAGIEGHAYDLLLVEVLRVLYPTQTIIHSPASLDFGPGNAYGPSADIVMGDIIEEGTIVPHILITAALRNKMKHQPTTNHNEFLQTPLLFLPASVFFPEIQHELFYFGVSNDPITFVNSLAKQKRKSLQKAINRILKK